MNNDLLAHLAIYDTNIRSRANRLKTKLDLCVKAPEILTPEEFQKLSALTEPVRREISRLEALHQALQVDLIGLYHEEMGKVQRRIAEPLFEPSRALKIAAALSEVESIREQADSEALDAAKGRPRKSDLNDMLRRTFLGWVEKGSLDGGGFWPT